MYCRGVLVLQKEAGFANAAGSRSQQRLIQLLALSDKVLQNASLNLAG